MVKPRTAKKIKNNTGLRLANGFTKDNIEWIKTYLCGIPPTPPEGFTESEYWEYLDFKYGDYNSPEYMTKRAGFYTAVVGKPCLERPQERPKMSSLYRHHK
ncbi:MAG: hypothetical protein KME22_09345 [Hassallia sp. WJT32-NPBG1]|jgi:hypothetical protein|nr:hypothetical protein [Hassallia sp. WJT32-NPBG1]